MQFLIKTNNSKLFFPTVSSYSLLNEKLILFLRPWGSYEYNQKFAEEISYYISSSAADIEITTPFDFLTNQTSLANRCRTAMLLAHDFFSKNTNKSEYIIGFESLVLLQEKNEIAWASVGRFCIDKYNYLDQSRQTIFNVGSSLDQDTLLPVELLGVERDLCINVGSVRTEDDKVFLISSSYNCDLSYRIDSTGQIDIESNNHLNGSFWSAQIRT